MNKWEDTMDGWIYWWKRGWFKNPHLVADAPVQPYQEQMTWLREWNFISLSLEILLWVLQFRVFESALKFYALIHPLLDVVFMNIFWNWLNR